LVDRLNNSNEDAGERGNDGVIAPWPFIKGATEAEVPYHNSIISHFMVYKDRLETNLLQLFAHAEISEWISAIFVIISEVNIVAQQKQT